VAFAPDGMTLATGSADGTVKLWRAAGDKEASAKGTELDPDDPHGPVAQNNRGDQLQTIGRPREAEAAYRQAISRLEKLLVHLPNSSEYRQALGASYFSVGVVLAAAGQREEAEKAYRKGLELGPGNPMALNNLAWLLATSPDAKFRDPGRAVELAKKAVELAPKAGTLWNTLGVAHYRARDWKAATAALEKSKELLGDTELSFNAFFLAMAHWQLGNQDEARKWYDKAVQWMEKNKPQDEELRRLRAEAAELLTIREKKEGRMK
jgi:eukaryotic-like serine/threonine-protein kinase